MEAWTHSILATSLPTVRESSCEEERRVVKGLVVERYVDREREQPLYDRSKPIIVSQLGEEHIQIRSTKCLQQLQCTNLLHIGKDHLGDQLTKDHG